MASVLEHHPAVGRERVVARIQELYQRPSAPEPPIYATLVRLPVDHFITTNYDPWLKNAFARRLGAAPRVYGPTDEGAFSDTLPGSPPLVLMVHGDADRAATCVLSSEGYARLSHGNAAWQQGMRQLIGQRRLVFIGYSLSDPDVVDLLGEWQVVFAPHGDAPRHFLLDAQVSLLRKSKLRRLGVEVIETGDHALLPEVLELLAAPPPGFEPAARTPERPNLRGYLIYLVDDTDHIKIAGIGGKAGKVHTELDREFPRQTRERVFERGREWLEFECLASGIIERIGTSEVRFWHLTFQEYLAAVELTWLVALPEPEEPATETVSAAAWKLIDAHLDDAQWRETIDALPGCLFDGPGRSWVDKLLWRVAGEQTGTPTLHESARTAALLSRLTTPLDAYGYRTPPELWARYQEALARSLGIFTLEGASEVPVKTRIEVAEALGRNRDPRLGPEKDNFLDVPPAGLRMGKYPVTVEEYQRFMDTRGYEQEKYWDREGWVLREKEEWTQPREWEAQLEAPNRPVVGVSWYEARAYCAWLTDQLSRTVRLPTSDEWEAAATAEHGEYPWGQEEPDEERCNFAPDWKPNVGAPTPVGIYPRGDGRYGHSDLAGNVLEWCMDGPEGQQEAASWVRGGSWSSVAESLRSSIRLRYPAVDRYDLQGFRCVCAASSR